MMVAEIFKAIKGPASQVREREYGRRRRSVNLGVTERQKAGGAGILARQSVRQHTSNLSPPLKRSEFNLQVVYLGRTQAKA
jgi:hypothetical protein